MLNKKYDTEFCLFETTSLYGNIKGASMYDGMRPFLRYKGDTMSSFLLTMGEDIYFHLRDWFEERNNDEPLIHKGASSRKLKYQTKMIQIIKASLKDTMKRDMICFVMSLVSLLMSPQIKDFICLSMDTQIPRMFYLAKRTNWRKQRILIDLNYLRLSSGGKN